MSAVNAEEGATMAEGSSSRDLDERTGGFDEGKVLARKAHECPVPKPGGIIGGVLGFTRDDRDPAPARTRVATVKRGGSDR